MMFKCLPRSLVSLLLVFAVNGCVTVPTELRLVDMDVDMGLMQVKASCIKGYRSGNMPVAATSDTVLDASRISLLNWNIYKAKRDNWAQDFKKLIQKQDILVLQEAVLIKELSQALDKQRLNWSLNTAFYYDNVEAGVLTASRARSLRSCGLRAKEPLIRVPKTTLISEYRLSSGGTLLVANIHGINFTLGTQDYQHQINALAAAIQHHNGPVIVAGDFNTWSDRRMDIVDQMAEQLSLQAVTYKTHNRLKVFGNPLDHIFYRGLDLIQEESISVSSSDHNPIRVTFRVPVSQLAKIKL